MHLSKELSEIDFIENGIFIFSNFWQPLINCGPISFKLANKKLTILLLLFSAAKQMAETLK